MSTRIHRLIESILNEATKAQMAAIRSHGTEAKRAGKGAAQNLALMNDPKNTEGLGKEWGDKVNKVYKYEADKAKGIGKENKDLKKGILKAATGGDKPFVTNTTPGKYRKKS